MWFGLGATMMLRTSGRATLFDLMLCGYQVNSSALFARLFVCSRAALICCELEHSLEI
jgi:hypothetical protein